MVSSLCRGQTWARVLRVLISTALLVVGPTVVLVVLAVVARSVADRTPLSRVGAAGIGLTFLTLAVLFCLRRAAVPPPMELRVVAPRRGVRRSELMGGLLELLFYLLVGARMIWPVTQNLTTRVVGGGDGEQWMWQGWAIAQMVRDGNPMPWQLQTVVYPYGADLRLGDGFIPLAVATAWNLVTDNALLAYNLTVLTALLSAMAAARLLAKEFTTHRVAIALCAVAFATAPALYVRTFSHLNLMFAFALPLVLREVVRAVRGTHELRPVRLGLLLFLSYLTSFYYLMGAVLASVGLLAVLAIQERDVGVNMRRAVRFGVAMVLCAALMSPFLLLRLRHDDAERRAGAPAPSVDEAAGYGADGLAVFAQPPTARLELPGNDSLTDEFGTNLMETTSFPGYALLLGLGALFVSRSRLRWPIVVTSAVLWLLSLGPGLKVDGRWSLTDDAGRPLYWLPFTVVRDLPGLSALRAPNRLSFALAAVALVALAAALSRVATAPRPLRFASFGFVAVLLLGNLQTMPWVSDAGTTPATRAALEEVRRLARPGESLLVVPADCQRTVASVKLQIVHQTPEVGCPTFNAGLPWYSGMETYRSSSAYAAWRCDPERLGGTSVPFDPDLRPQASDIDSLHEELGVRFYVNYRSYRCEDWDRNVAFVALLRAETYLIGSDRLWDVFDAGRRPDGTPRWPTAAG